MISTFVRRWFPRSAARRSLSDAMSELWLAPEAPVTAAFESVRQGAERLQTGADVRAAIEMVAAEREEREAESPGYEVIDGVAVVPLTGMLMKAVPSAFDFFGISATSTIETRRALDTALQDESVQAVLLAIDSPGGTLSGTDDLGDAVFEARKVKPVHAHAADQAASAAYWIGSQAQRFTAGKTASVGSIGVYTSITDSSRAAMESGLVVHHIASGPEKGAGGTRGAPVTDAHRASIQTHVDRAADLFRSAVMRGRGFSDEQAQGVSSGRSWFGVDALELGLVDAVQSFDLALQQAREAGEARHHNRGESPRNNPAPTAGATEGNMTTKSTPAAPAAVDDLASANKALNAEITETKQALAAAEKRAEQAEAKVEMLTERLGTVKDDAVTAVLDKHCGVKFAAAQRADWEARAKKAFDGDAKGLDEFLSAMPDVLHTEAQGTNAETKAEKKVEGPDKFGLTSEDYELADNVVAFSLVDRTAETKDGALIASKED